MRCHHLWRGPWATVPVTLDEVVKSKDYVYKRIDGCFTAGLSFWLQLIIRVMGAWPSSAPLMTGSWRREHDQRRADVLLRVFGHSTYDGHRFHGRSQQIASQDRGLSSRLDQRFVGLGPCCLCRRICGVENGRPSQSGGDAGQGGRSLD